jgi:hypothetical protein
MALNVNWNWRMPTVGDPDKVAAGNRQDFLSGLDSIASGLIKSGENQRADEKQKWLETTNARDYAEKVRQFDATNRLQKDKQLYEQLNASRDYGLNLDRLKLAQEKQQYDIARQKMYDEWNRKAYEKFFGNSQKEQELQKLLEKYQGNGQPSPEQLELQKLLAKYQGSVGDATNVMNGLNPQLFKMR